MKQRKRWLGLAFAPALLALFGFASEASAYTCANVPASVSGDLIISESGNCTISHDVTVTNGNIQITSGGAISAQALTTTGGGNILLTATGNVGTNSLTTADGSNTAGIEINANTGGGGGVFNIGAGGANGVNGVLNTSNTTGGGTAPGFIHGGIFVTNGNSGSIGGITVSSMSAIQVKASASRSGIINLNAQNGTLTLPAGTLDSIGAAGQGGGSITLLAKTIATGNGTIISASQDYTAGGTSHGVTIAAQTVTVTGTGLKIQGDGNGITGSPGTAFATLAPQGSFTLTSNGDVHNLLWTINSSNFFYVDAGVTVSGTAPFTMTADGNYGRVAVTGHPVTFSNKAVTLQSKAATSHEVVIGFNGALNNSLGIGLNGTGTATIDVTAVKRTGDTIANGGAISLYGDNMTFNSPTLKFTANGPASGNGDGGTIYISSRSAKLKTTSKATLSANAASAAAGAGNANTNAIIFYPGAADVEVGNDAGQYLLTATGGKKSGNGGNITVIPSPGNINVHNSLTTTLPVNVSAIGTTGNGGKISLTASNVTFAGTSVALKADGGSTSGDGGEIHISGNGTINVGTTANSVGLSAKAPGTSNTDTNHGGLIEIAYTTNLTVDGAAIDVTAGGNADGGEINIHDIGTLTLSGTLNANATGAGNSVGGTIILSAYGVSLPASSNTLVSATSAGTGRGGDITVNSIFTALNVGAANNQIRFNANNTGSGAGGSVSVTAGGPITAQAASINVTAGPTIPSINNFGGTISLTTTSGSINASGTFQASAGPLGSGGLINFQSAQDINLADQTKLLAIGNGNQGNGGDILLTAGAASNATGTINYATSNILVDSSGTTDKAGNVLIKIADPTSTSVLQLLGPIQNNGTKVGAGVVDVTNKYATGVRANTSIISAVNGQITFRSGTGPVTVTGLAPALSSGPYFGPVSLSGTDLSLHAIGSADLLLGAFNATGNIQIQTDIGNMMSDGSNELVSSGNSGTIKLISTSGQIGTGALKPVNVSAKFVDFDLGTTPSVGTQVLVNTFGPITVKSLVAYGNIFLNGDSNIVLSQNIKTTQGNVGIQTNGGSIVLNTGVEALAQEGTLFFQGQTAITLMANSKVKAVTTTTNTSLGNVDISLLTVGSGFTTTTPANIAIASGGQYIKFGTAGITANAPVNTLASTGQRFLLLDTNGLPPQFIVLGGGVTISALGN